MILSMTGCGECERIHEGIRYTLTLRSLNHRYLKISVRVPDALAAWESRIEQAVRDRLKRGSLHCVLHVGSAEELAAPRINQKAVSHYLAELQKIRVPQGISPWVDLAALCSFPGVLEDEAGADGLDGASIGALLSELVRVAVDGLLDMRRKEGVVLHEEFERHCREMEGWANRIASRAEVVPAEYGKRLQDRANQLLEDARLTLEEPQLLREVALFAERCDISEELSRLKAHIGQFTEVCRSEEHAGRKLDFLSQEMLREVNTIGSKSSDLTIARSVVELKTLVDRLKEQIQNVE